MPRRSLRVTDPLRFIIPPNWLSAAEVYTFLESLTITECVECRGRFIETPDRVNNPKWLPKLDTCDQFGWTTYDKTSILESLQDDDELYRAPQDEAQKIKHPCKEWMSDNPGRICEWCYSTNWYNGNDLDAGPDVPALAALTEFEEMLIAPAHCAIQVWTLSGQKNSHTNFIIPLSLL